MFGKRTGMQLNELAAGPRRGFDLLRVGSDEQADLDANLALKEEILAKMRSPNGTNSGRYKPPDSLLAFLNGL